MNIPRSKNTGERGYKHMNIPRSKNTGERGYKHMNVPHSKNTKGSIKETLPVDLHRYNKSMVKDYINRCNTGEREHKHMNIPHSKTPKVVYINETYCTVIYTAITKAQ